MPSIAASVAGAAEIGAAAAATGSLTARRVAVVVVLVRVAVLRAVVAGAAVSAGAVVSAEVDCVGAVSVAVGSGAAVSGDGETVVSAVVVGVSATSCASKGVEDKASTAAIAVRPERACFTVYIMPSQPIGTPIGRKVYRGTLRSRDEWNLETADDAWA
jgi:hypothetical protein